ncbi:MAG: tandem-95 repeat protein [Tunicatimonas sp.]
MRIDVYQLLNEFLNPFATAFCLLLSRTSIIRPAVAALLLIAAGGMVQAATPVVNAPATQNVERETYLVFNSTNSNLISITDADDNNQTVTITVTNGSFFLEDVSGLTSASFTGTGQQEITAGAPVSFSGSLDDVNAALSEASFYPTNGYAGPASVQITTDDGTGNTDTKTISITVLAGIDTDGDGIYDHQDLDDDNDGIPDNVENPCEKTFAFNLSSEGWFTVNDNNGNKRSSNANEIPASHSTDGRTQNVNDSSEPLPGCPIDNTGRANKNIAGASPTRTAYIVDTDPSGGLMYLRSPNLGGIDYSELLGGTFQYDAYNYRVNKSGDPGWLLSGTNKSRATVYIFDTQGKYVRAQSDLTQNPHYDRFEAGLWNTFAFTLDGAVWTGDASLADVLADVDQISIRMEYISGGNTNECDDVEYYAMDNVVLTAEPTCDDDIDNDGVPNYLDLDSDGDGTFDAVEAGHGQPHTNGVVNGPVGTDGIPDAVQGQGNGNTGGATYPPALDLDGDNSSGASGADYQTTFVQGGPFQLIADADATLYDGSLEKITVTLTNRPDGDANESLLIDGTLPTNLTSSYNASNGELTITPTAGNTVPVADFLAALKQVGYNNTSVSNTAPRIVEVIANDGTNDSNLGTTTVTVKSTNTDPVVTVPGSQTIDEDNPLTFDTSKLISISDTDGDDQTVSIVVSNGTLTLSGTTGLTVSAGSDGSAAMTFSGSQTDINAALKDAVFTPTPDYHGTAASVQVTTSDGSVTDTKTVAITVNPVNDPPTAADKTLTTDEDAAKIVATTDLGYSDPESDPLSKITLTAVPGPTQGTLFIDEDQSGSLDNGEVALATNDEVTKAQLDDSKLTFSPRANAFGSAYASFAFRVNDGTADAVAANTITFDVDPVNDTPVNNLPAAQSVEANATLVLSGFDAMSVSDDARTNPIVVTLSVTNGTVNIPADPDNIVTDNGTATVTLTGTILQINVALNGLEYTGNLNYSGPEELTITTNDQGHTGTGGPLTDTDKLAITVTPPNEAPVVFLNGTDNAAEYPATFTEDGGPVAVADASAATITDADHTTLTELTVTVTNIADVGEELLTVVGLPASLSSSYDPTTGILEITNADVSSPGSVADYQTALRGVQYENTSQNPLATARLIRVVATDGIENSAVAETSMNVVPVNDAPVVSVPDPTANPQSTDEDTPLTFATANLISISDVDANDQTVTITVTDGTFKLSGDNGLTGLTGDGTAAVIFTGNLTDINAALENATFTPTAEFSGTATVTIETDDGNPTDNTDSQSLNVTVNATNDAPTADNANVTTYVDETYTFVDTDFSADYADDEANAFAGIKITAPVTAGTLTLNGSAVTVGQTITVAELSSGGLVFAPAAGVTGNPHATFPFQVIDSEGASSIDYTMSVAVKARPTSADATVTAQEDLPLNLTDTDFAFSDAADASDAFAGIIITQLPAQGTLSYDGAEVTAADVSSQTLFPDRNKFSYASPLNENGTGYATVGFRVRDAAGDESLPHTLTLDVAPVDDLPEVSNVPKSTITNQAVTFDPADFIDQFADVDSDPLAEIIITSLPPATEGTLTLDGQPATANTPIPAISLNKLRFTPAPGFTGTSSFGWNASDGNNYATDAAQIVITVTPQTPPVVSNVPKASAEGETVPFTPADFTAAYTDADSNPLQTVKITSLPPVAQGTLFLDGVAVAVGDEVPLADTDKLTFVPAVGFAGTATFGWNGFDGTAYAPDESTVTHTINAAPKVAPESLSVTTGTTYFGTLAEQVTDAEGHTLTFNTTPVTDVAHGTLTLNDDGSFIYVPEVGYTGEDSFTYTVCDDGSPSACTTGTATLTVGTTDAPDSDNDGIPDAVEIGSDPNNPIDSDGDVTPDYLDTDSDGDGIPDATEAGSDPTTPQDTDGDGIPDHLDQDADGDGIPDATEVGADPANPTDSDGDGIPDYRDPDNTPEPPEDDLVIYGGFSPNDDNTNETWEIAGIENYPNNTVQIYNRWGNLLFEVQGYNNRDKAWGSDSSVGLILGSKNVPDGTYFYLIDLGDGSPIRKGFITVHR